MACTNTFAPLLTALAAYSKRVQAAEDRRTSLREAAVQSALERLTPPPSDFDAALHAQCGAMVQEAERCSSVMELQASPLFAPYVVATGELPAVLLARDNMPSLRRLLEARHRRTTEASAAERQANAALSLAQSVACSTAEIAAVEKEAKEEHLAALAEFTPWLARSDHMPIRADATFSLGGGTHVRLASHNVQEHVQECCAATSSIQCWFTVAVLTRSQTPI